MSEIEVVFLGVNDAGMRVYEWLCEREGVFVRSLLTTTAQLDAIREDPPDYVVAAGYRHVVPEDVLAQPTEGCLNLHPSFLPYNRGANPNVWAIADDTPAGVSLHYMDADLDTGPILQRKRVQTSFADTGKDLYRRLEDAQFDLFTETWPAVEVGEIEATPQDPVAGTTHTTSEFDALREIDPEATYTATELLDVLRALTFPPYDNAYLDLDDGRYYVDVDIRKDPNS